MFSFLAFKLEWHLSVIHRGLQAHLITLLPCHLASFCTVRRLCQNTSVYSAVYPVACRRLVLDVLKQWSF